jgi:hypothetical protein
MKISAQVHWSPQTTQAEELVLLHMGTGAYYRLNRLGSTIWRLLHEHMPSTGIVATLQDRYEIDTATATAAVQRFLDQLTQAGLLIDERHSS